MSDWNAAWCARCWDTTNPDRVPVRLVHPQQEICANCGAVTHSGIYVRQDPAEQKFPAR